MSRARALGLVLGFAADRALGDPRRGHPVALFGRVAHALERRCWADNRRAGLGYTGVLVGAATGLGVLLERATAERPVARCAATAVATWTVLGGLTLEREALAVHAHLAADDLPAARRRLTHLVSRDTRALGADDVARAVVESVAENTSDAVVAPLFWGAVAGVPGLLGYRAVNTLDAMVGYRSPRYVRFGWASARADDLANLPGARLTGLLVALAAPARAGATLAAWRRDAAAHPSPNAGVVEAAFAGTLGIRLGGTNDYGSHVEHRAVLGDGPAPRADDVARTVALARRVGVLAAGGTAALSLLRSRR